MKTISLLLLTILFVSCSTRKQDQLLIQKKVSQETSVSDGKTLGESVNEAIHNSKTLDEKQKSELKALFDQTKNKNKALLEESFKLRAVLIKELLSEGATPKQVKMLKKNIKKTESERLKTTLLAIDQISKIVKNDPDGEMLADHLMYIDNRR